MKKTHKYFILSFIAIIAIITGFIFFNAKEAPKIPDIEIGVIFPLTGTAAYMGEATFNAVKLASEEINASGELGNRNLKIFAEDSKADPKEAVTAFHSLTSLHKLTAMYCLTAADTFAVAPLSNRMKLIFFTGTIAPGAANLGDYVFRNASNLTNDAEKLAELCANKLKIKRVAMLAVNLPIIGSLLKAFQSKLEALGGTFLGIEYGNIGDTDFRTQLSKINALNPQAIYCIGYKEIGYIFKQARELGINVQFLGASGMESPEIVKIAGKAAEGAIYTQADDNLGRDFVDTYQKKYGKTPDVNAAQAYDSIKILANVIGQKNMSSDEIRTKLLEIKNYPGVSGRTSFLPNGDTNKPPIFKMIKDGKFVTYQSPNNMQGG